MVRTRKDFILPKDKCCYCNRSFSEDLKGTREHIIAKANGGSDKMENLTPCCFECNQLRGSLTLHQFRSTVWEVMKILNGKYSINLNDLEKVYENLRD